MKKREEIAYEPGLIMIFRLFCGAVAIVFYIFSANPPVLYRINLDEHVWFYMGLAYTLVFIYLLIPIMQNLFHRYFLPLAIIATILIPIFSLSWQPYILEGSYIELSVVSSYSISILLMFPLIVTAWQYNFKVVILFFVILGGIDPLIYLALTGPADQYVAASLYSSLIRIVSFVAIGFVITELMKNQRKRQKELSDANKKLQKQAHYARELSATRERNRLAHELHDVLAHTLSSLAVQLEAIKATIPTDSERSLELLEKALQNTRSGLQETRRTVRNLRAEPLEELGFQQAVYNLLEDAERRGGFKIAVQYDPILDVIDYTNEQSVYRIVQEALENIIQHAEASQVTVSFKRMESKSIFITIEDDGRGFDPAKTDDTKHFGIATMRERASSIGATYAIDSTPGAGTRIILEIPGRKES